MRDFDLVTHKRLVHHWRVSQSSDFLIPIFTLSFDSATVVHPFLIYPTNLYDAENQRNIRETIWASNFTWHHACFVLYTQSLCLFVFKHEFLIRNRHLHPRASGCLPMWRNALRFPYLTLRLLISSETSFAGGRYWLHFLYLASWSWFHLLSCDDLVSPETFACCLHDEVFIRTKHNALIRMIQIYVSFYLNRCSIFAPSHLFMVVHDSRDTTLWSSDGLLLLCHDRILHRWLRRHLRPFNRSYTYR